MTGISSRFTAAGYDRPKALIEIDGETVIDHVIDMYPGWDDVVFICNADHLADPRLRLRERLLERRPQGTVVEVAAHKLGPGHAVLEAADHIARDKPVVVNYCDFTSYWDADDFADYLGSGVVTGGAIPAYRGFHPHTLHTTSYAYPKLEGQYVVDIQEKQPWTDDPHSEFASSGTYGFVSGQVLLDALEHQVKAGYLLNGEFYLSLTYKSVLDLGLTVGVYELQHFMQWGTPQDLEEYREWSNALAHWLRGPAEPEPHATRVVLASGAGKRFADLGYDRPKPLLDVAGRTLLEHALLAVPGAESVVVTRSDLGDGGAVADLAVREGAAVVELAGLSRGQADSALSGLRPLLDSAPDRPVTVTACDAVPRPAPGALAGALRAAGDDGLVVWIAPGYRLARRRPQQYGWVTWDDEGLVQRTWLKEAPEDPAEAGVIIGTFSFPSARTAAADIEELLSSDETVNGEYYLDSLVRRFVAAGRPVVVLLLDSFVSLGTPDEYETFRYWQSCFHKWVHHPYALAADPMVPPTARAELDRTFRDFVPTASGRTWA
nr:NTP transferase domain-containing protein [Petropleomorpha daqingensis]